MKERRYHQFLIDFLTNTRGIDFEMIERMGKVLMFINNPVTANIEADDTKPSYF